MDFSKLYTLHVAKTVKGSSNHGTRGNHFRRLCLVSPINNTSSFTLFKTFSLFFFFFTVINWIQFSVPAMINFKQTQLLTFLCCFLILLPSLVRGNNCTCEPEEKERINKPLALKYKMAAIASILVAGAIGVCFPLLGKIIKPLRPEKNVFFMIKAFAAGVILSTGFIHVLPDASESLTSPCLKENPWGKFPFAGLVAMTSAIGTLMVDAFATSHFSKRHFNKMQQLGVDEEKTGEHEKHLHVHTHATHGHSHGSISSVEGSGSTELLRHRVISQVNLV